MTPEEITIKRESTVLYKGVPFKVAGFREGTQDAILEAWFDAPLSELEIVDDAKYKEGANTETALTSDDFLYTKIHKQIREEVKNMKDFTEKDLQDLIKNALKENLDANNADRS